MVEGFNARLGCSLWGVLAAPFFWAVTTGVAATAADAQAVTALGDSAVTAEASHSHVKAIALASALTVSVLEDRQIDRFMRHHATRTLDAIARAVDPFGRAEY